ncbi:type II toxin-antitoxin system VapB family antitoxin [Streptomyces sp. NPDC088812]|uniref:type II toxin-antitoxin system VapB family antitoxin n=1 Tax=Streptomyces sp. NPDC088812 TaxID=3365905 RepID=UPI0038167289
MIAPDDEALEAAVGRDTANTALRQSVARNRRLHALHRLQDLAAEGGLDAEALLDKRAYRGGATR